jgi:hypothetical protein
LSLNRRSCKSKIAFFCWLSNPGSKRLCEALYLKTLGSLRFFFKKKYLCLKQQRVGEMDEVRCLELHINEMYHTAAVDLRDLNLEIDTLQIYIAGSCLIKTNTAVNTRKNRKPSSISISLLFLYTYLFLYF